MFLSLLETEWYPILFDTPSNIVRSVAIWLTIAAVIVFLACFFAFKGEKRKKFARYYGIGAVVYACVIGVLFLVLSFMEDGIAPILFYPLLALIIVLASGALTLFFRRDKITYIVVGCLAGAALIASLVCMGVNFSWGDALINNWLTDEEGNLLWDQVNTVGLYVSAALLVVAIIAAAFLCGRKDKKGFSTRSITFAAICIAMSFALSYLRIVTMPQGGSITIASLLPLMIYSYMFGTKKGVFAGFIYGILQAFQDPAILHPAQFLLDYPLAFSAIGLTGMFANTKSLKYPQIRFAFGAIVGAAGRFLMHFLSGIFAFGYFATIQPVWLYSLVYQAGYVLPDIAIALVIGVLVFSSKTFVREMERRAENLRVFTTPAAPMEEDEHVATCSECGAKFTYSGNVAKCPYCNTPVEHKEDTKTNAAVNVSKTE